MNIEEEKKDHDEGKDVESKSHSVVGTVLSLPQKMKDVLNKIRGENADEPKEVEVTEDDSDEAGEGDVSVKDDEEDETFDSDDESSDKDASESEDEERLTIEGVDPKLIAAGRELGWSDDKILAIVETDESVLTDLADLQASRKKDESDGKDEQEGAESAVLTDEQKVSLREKMGDEVADILIKQQEDLRSVSEELADVRKFRASSEEDAARAVSMRKLETANEIFDRAFDTFPEIGKTDELPRTPDGSIRTMSNECKVRSEIYSVAEMFFQTNGGSFESAMDEALSWYGGRDGKKSVVRTVVKDLNRRKRKFSPKPTKKKTKLVFKDANQKAGYIVKQAKRKAGFDV